MRLSGGVPGHTRSNSELSDYGGMVRWPLELSGCFIDVCLSATLGHLLTGEDEVNTQSYISSESSGAVIPPTETFFFLLEKSERIG